MPYKFRPKPPAYIRSRHWHSSCIAVTGLEFTLFTVFSVTAVSQTLFYQCFHYCNSCCNSRYVPLWPLRIGSLRIKLLRALPAGVLTVACVVAECAPLSTIFPRQTSCPLPLLYGTHIFYIYSCQAAFVVGNTFISRPLIEIADVPPSQSENKLTHWGGGPACLRTYLVSSTIMKKGYVLRVRGSP